MKGGQQKLLGEIVFQYFKVVRKIGQGAFGEIFQVQHTRKGYKFALKIQSLAAYHPQLMNEAKIYKEFHNAEKIQGIPRVYATGAKKGFNLMLMDKLGKSLQDLLVDLGGKFSLKTVIMVGMQLIDRIEFMHSKGFLHRDLKPNNLLIGSQQKKKMLYLIDMGLSNKYYIKQRHIPYKEGKQLIGTVRYASISAHKGCQQSRRDDIEAIGYILMYFLRGILPWQNMKAVTIKEKHKLIMLKKIETPLSILCQGFPEEFITFIEHARNIQFEEKPNYEFFKRLLMSAAQRNKLQIDQCYDWNQQTTQE